MLDDVAQSPLNKCLYEVCSFDPDGIKYQSNLGVQLRIVTTYHRRLQIIADHIGTSLLKLLYIHFQSETRQLYSPDTSNKLVGIQYAC